MYTIEKIDVLKSDIKTAVQTWGEHKIDQLCSSHPRLSTASIYIKRGLKNYLSKSDKQISSYVDAAMLFIADENGNIDTDMLINDAVSIFRQMDVYETQMAGFNIKIGKGELNLEIPSNPMLDFLFGDLGKIRLNADDLLEIKQLLK